MSPPTTDPYKALQSIHFKFCISEKGQKVYQRQLLMKGWVFPGSPLSVDQKSYTIKNFLPYKINLELAHCVLLTVLLAVDCLVDS